jgi:hypothetical protein
MTTEAVEAPFGLNAFSDGKRTFVSLDDLRDVPLRRQLRDALMSLSIDHGGRAKSTKTLQTYANAIRRIFARYSPENLSGWSIRSLDFSSLKRDVFPSAERRTTNSTMSMSARRLLVIAAMADYPRTPTGTVTFLGALQLNNPPSARPAYEDEELVSILEWATTRLYELEQRWSTHLQSFGGDPALSDQENENIAHQYLIQADIAATREGRSGKTTWRQAGKRITAPTDRAWWSASLYAVGFGIETTPTHPSRRAQSEAEAALFPDFSDAIAAMTLVINEYGAEQQLLRTMDIDSAQRMPGNSSVVRITGIKFRADRAVSRKGNGVSPWSGGAVLERWTRLTAASRRWAATRNIWIWRSRANTNQLAQARFPIYQTIVEESIKPWQTVPHRQTGAPIVLRFGRLRKNWIARTERAVGPGLSGTLDPAHSSAVDWSFYRMVGLTADQRLEVVARAQEELRTHALVFQLVIDTNSDVALIREALLAKGIPEGDVDKIVKRDWDSGTAGCRSPREAPGQTIGTLCRQTPFACFVCPNAIFTSVHVPLLIALDDQLSEEAKAMPAEEYLALWGGVHPAVRRVLDGFSAQVIAGAEKELRAAESRLKDMAGVYL